MIINSRGTYKVYLTYIDENSNAIPILSFRIIMKFSHSKCVRVPVYIGEGDQEVIQLPKNGVLPKDHWVKFRVKSGGSKPTFIRVFVNYYVKELDLNIKIELFKTKKKARLNDTKESISMKNDDDVEYFERYIFSTMENLTVVAESYPDHTLQPLGEFQILEYRNDFFDGIEPSWLNFLPYSQHVEQRKIWPQVSKSSHSMRLEMKIDQKFQDPELYTLVQQMMKQKLSTPEKLIDWIFT